MKKEMKKTNMKKIFLTAVLVALTVCVFPAVSPAGVTFEDGQHVKLGYATAAPPVWEVKNLPGTAESLFLGAPISAGAGYGATSAWSGSNVERYLNATYLIAHFSPEELAAGVLTPYGDTPVYDVVVPGLLANAAAYDATAFGRKAGGSKAAPAVAVNPPDIELSSVTIPPSSAGSSLVWIMDVQEIQAIYNGAANLPWNDATKCAARLPYVLNGAGGAYRTRGVYPDDPSTIWSIGADGAFSRGPVSESPSIVRPVVSPDVSAMLYKRGTGTQVSPYSVAYPWNVAPSVSAVRDTNMITLRFSETVANNGTWPGADAWTITDKMGTAYTVTGTSGTEDRVTLTVFPALAENTELTLEYSQRFDDPTQGLNNTKGAILRGALSPGLSFALPRLTLTIGIADDGRDDGGDDGDDGDEKDDEEDDENEEEEGDDEFYGGTGLRIVTDSLQYLVLGQPYSIDLEAEGGSLPYAWNVKDGLLPSGLTLRSEGIVEGTPTSAGGSYATIQVSDSAGETAAKKFTFVVVASAELAIMTDTLPDAQVGQFYIARLRGCGGAKPYSWAIDALPDWLVLDPSSGILAGVPLVSAIHDLTVRLEDDEGAADTKSLRISAEPHDGLLIDTRVLPAAVYGQDYSVQLEASGGIPPYFFALRRGYSLPPGLELENTGILSGTPAQKGIYDFVLDAIDGNDLQGSAVYTMVVLDEEVLNPDNGDFTAEEYEDEKEVQLSFFLPKDFDDTKVLSVEALASPDSSVASSGSRVTREENGYKIELTLHVAEYALNDGASWESLMEGLTFEGFTVKFQNASGEALRFANPNPLRVRDFLRKEEESPNGKGGGGGCNAGWSALLFLALVAVLLKAQREER